jgi:signal transduction histidine kinase
MPCTVGSKTNSTFGQFFSLFPIGLAVCGLVVTVTAAHIVTKREEAQARDHAEAEARHVSAQLRVGLAQAFEPLHRIAAWWLLQGRPTQPQDWENDARLFVNSGVGLQRLLWINTAGVPVWSVWQGAAPVFGDLGPLEAPLATALAEARNGSGPRVSRVFEADGRPRVYVCVRVRDHGRVAGHMAGLYDVKELTGTQLENQLPEQYAITITADGRSFSVPGTRTEGVHPGFAREAQVQVANATWHVTVAPAFDGSSGIDRSIVVFGVLGSVLLYVCAAMAKISRQRARDLGEVNAQLVVENQERRRAEEKVAELNRNLQRKLQEFQTLLNVLPVGIAVAEDRECRHIWTNRALAAMLNVPVGENISRSSPSRSSFQMMRNGVEVPPEELPMQTAVRTAAPVANEYLDLVRADGSVLHTLSYAAPLFDESGKVRGVIDVCVDITKRKILEDRLQEAQKSQSLALMAGGIAHDFNNLLTVIVGNASTVLMELPVWSESRRSLEDLQEAAARATALVAQLLAFTGRFWCEVSPMALTREVEALIPAIREMAPPSISIVYDLAPGLPLIEAGPAEIQKVVESLVSNAAEAIGEGCGGRIEIRTSECRLSKHDVEIFYPGRGLAPGLYVRLEVADDGCGIPDEILGRVFDPFFTTKFVGRGLGLSAVQGIVRAHGGAIRVTSALHHGTRVELVFPAWAPTPEASPKAPAGRA